MDNIVKAGFLTSVIKVRYIRPLVHSRAKFMPWPIISKRSAELPLLALSLGDGPKRTSDNYFACGARGLVILLISVKAGTIA